MNFAVQVDGSYQVRRQRVARKAGKQNKWIGLSSRNKSQLRQKFSGWRGAQLELTGNSQPLPNLTHDTSDRYKMCIIHLFNLSSIHLSTPLSIIASSYLTRYPLSAAPHFRSLIPSLPIPLVQIISHRLPPPGASKYPVHSPGPHKTLFEIYYRVTHNI